MTHSNSKKYFEPDPQLDLVLERVIDVSPEHVWAAWTQPEHVKKWFTPDPWKTVDCEIDLRPCGIFRTVMQSPEGQEFPNLGCFLEIIPNRRLVWTNVLGPGFRPANVAAGSCGDFGMTAKILMEPHEKGTKYTAIALHYDKESSQKHATMGFQEGWGKALDQLVALAKTL